MGGYRRHIKYQLAKDKFQLGAGERIKDFTLKIPAVLPADAKQPIVQNTPPPKPQPKPNSNEEAANNLSWNNEAPTLTSVKLTEKSPDKAPLPADDPSAKKEQSLCADIVLADLKIIKEDDKSATLRYTIENQGDGVFYLFGKKAGQSDNLHLNAYLSGVTVLTRGALPISSQPSYR